MEEILKKVATKNGFNLLKVGYEKHFKYVFVKKEISDKDKDSIKLQFSEEIKGFFRKKKIFSLINNVFFMEHDFINTSLDIYPMEFLRYKTHAEALVGEDVFKNIEIEKKFLRLALEREVKGFHMKLRSAFLISSGDMKITKEIIKNTEDYLNEIFISFLCLKDIKAAKGIHDNAALMAKATGINVNMIVAKKDDLESIKIVMKELSFIIDKMQVENI